MSAAAITWSSHQAGLRNWSPSGSTEPPSSRITMRAPNRLAAARGSSLRGPETLQELAIAGEHARKIDRCGRHPPHRVHRAAGGELQGIETAAHEHHLDLE